jgi:hypothetical protein
MSTASEQHPTVIHFLSLFSRLARTASPNGHFCIAKGGQVAYKRGAKNMTLDFAH